jgi:hypothetical protein
LFGFEPVTQETYHVTGDQVDIDTSIDGVELYVNGKPTSIIFGKEENEYFYPAFADGSQSVQAVAKFPWGEARSEAVTITDLSERYMLEVPLTDQTKEEVLAFSKQFLETLAKSYETKDIKALQSMYHSSYDEDLLQVTQKELGAFHPYADFYGYDLKAVTLMETGFGKFLVPFKQVNAFYDDDAKRFVVKVSSFAARYSLTMTNGSVEDGYGKYNFELTHENGKWVVLRRY